MTAPSPAAGMDVVRALQAFEGVRMLAKPHMLIADHERYVDAYMFVQRLAAEVAELRERIANAEVVTVAPFSGGWRIVTPRSIDWHYKGMRKVRLVPEPQDAAGGG